MPTTPDAQPSLSAARARTLLERIARFEGAPADLLRLLVELQASIVGATHAAILRTPDPAAVTVAASSPPIADGDPTPGWLRRAAPLARPALDAGDPRVAEAPDGAGTIIVVPLTAVGDPSATACFLVPTPIGQLPPDAGPRAHAAAATLAIYGLHERAAHASIGSERLITAIDVASAVNACDRFGAAANALVGELAARLGCERVSLGTRRSVRDDTTRLDAISGVDKLSRGMDLARDIAAAMDESLDQDLEAFFPYPPSESIIARQQEHLSRRHGPSAVATVPLRSAAGPVAAITLERDPNRPFTRDDLTLLRLTANLAAPRLVDLRERDRPLPLRAARGARRGAISLLGPRHALAKLLAIALIAVIVAAAVVPGADVATAPFIIEAADRRAVSAPHDGFLASIAVEVGDEVRAGGPLATLDDAEVLLELAEARADRAALARSADASRGAGDIAQAQVAEARIDQADARIALLESTLDRCRLTAPIGGVVLRAPAASSLDAPVRRGDPLFEVAPVGTLRAEVAIPEDRLAQVAVGQRGAITAAGAPDDPIGVSVASIAPAATEPPPERPAAGPTFAVRVDLDRRPDWLRPGMRGVARIEVGRASYLRIWTRELTNWIRLNLWL